MSIKPVHQRVAEKIATQFDDEERGYLWVSLTQNKKQASANPPAPAADAPQSLYDEALFNDSSKLAHEDPAMLANVYEQTINQLGAEKTASIEARARADAGLVVRQREDFRKAAFLQGIYQYQGFKFAAAQEQQTDAQTKVASRLAQKAPAIARAVNGR